MYSISDFCCREKYGNWTEEDLKSAINVVESGLGLNAASREFGVPKATLKRHTENKNGHANRVTTFMRRPTVLSSKLENELVDHVLSWEAVFVLFFFF